MGMHKNSLRLLFQEGKKKPFQGKILTLGKQDISISSTELKKTAKQFSYPLHTQIKNEKKISDVVLFKALGFSECKSLDMSAYEGADYLFDLNQSDLPSHLHETFDVIIDGGTIEHVFHVPNALKNIFSMLKCGGKIFHFSPASNYLDHGFYMFSPTLFLDFYEANSFQIESCQLIKHLPNQNIDWKFFPYTPGSLEHLSYGGLDHKMYSLCFIAKKTKDSTGIQIPYQHRYSKGTWNHKIDSSQNSFLKETIKKIPGLYRFFSKFKKIKVNFEK